MKPGGKRIVIRGGRLVLVDRVVREDLIIEGKKLAKIGKVSHSCTSRATILDLNGLYVSPGFIDLQVNGGAGYNFVNARDKEIERIVSFHVSHGTTGLLATLVTSPVDQLRQAMQSIKRAQTSGILGIHLEGPFISPERRGAHNPEHILKPSLERFRVLTNGYRDLIRMVTVAPELSGADQLIKEAQGFAVPALGHSNATYEEARAAVEQGVRFFTHFFNAMSGFHHREPGAVGAGFDLEVMVGLIADGVHVHPAAVRLLLKAKGVDKICLVTDSIAAAGLGDGRYSLAGQEVVVEDGIARLTDGTLAGSTLTMERALKNFMRFTNLSLPEAVRAATLNPARLLGLEQKKGSIAVGKDADLVVFDEDFNVHYTILGGEIIYASADSADRLRLCGAKSRSG